MDGVSASGSASTVSEDDNFVVSYEDSSCPADTEIELGLALSLGLMGQRDSGVSCAEDCSSSSSSSSLSRASVTAGIKRTADSMAATNGQVVGWPPIRTYRMNSMVNQAKTLAIGEPNSETRKSANKNRTIVRSDVKIRKSMFLKVTMDGIPIGRKIDLNAHWSYESLSKALEDMFLKPSAGLSTRENNSCMETRSTRLLDGSSGFVLTYEDKEGDWMLVGDVPWGMFLGSVKRLRIMRTSEATGTAQRIT